MPAHGAGGKVTLWKFTLWLRDILIGLGENLSSKSMAETGSHSCEATTRSWMSKAGMNKDDRKWPGGHLKRNEASLAPYSRDMLSCPLRRIQRLYVAVRRGDFMPDSSRSSRWRTEVDAEAALGKPALLGDERPQSAEQLPVPPVVVTPAPAKASFSSSSSSSSSSKSTGSSEQSDRSSGAPDAIIEAIEGARKRWKRAGTMGHPMWRHRRTKVFHVQREGEQLLACSRLLDDYEVARDLYFTYPRCLVCFGTELARDHLTGMFSLLFDC